MNHSLDKLFIALSLGTISVFSGCSEASTSKPRQNIVFILADDLGWTDLGCYGSTFYETPNIDQFAQESVVFTNAYASASICSPTRASILTGKHPVRLNITDWIPGKNPLDRKLLGATDLHALPKEEVTIAELLKESGYSTCFIGKWHLGGESNLPTDHGFDYNIGGNHRGSPDSYYSPYSNPNLEDGPKDEYLTDRLTDESIKFIEENSNKPFFLYLSYYTVHTPIQAQLKNLEHFVDKKKTIESQSQNKTLAEGKATTRLDQIHPEYASMVSSLDDNFGKLLGKLKELGLEDNTTIIFTSDNGGLSTLESGYNMIPPTANKPLRAGKGWLYEGGIRVPLLIKHSTGNAVNKILDVPVISTDFYPTILDIANISEYSLTNVDGLSLTSLLANTQESLDRQELYWHYPHYHGSGWKPGSAIRVGNWKLIEFFESNEYELYDLSVEDEKQNLAHEYPEKLREMKLRLFECHKKYGAKFPTINSSYEAAE